MSAGGTVHDATSAHGAVPRRTIGPYELTGELGRGRTGRVFSARRAGLERTFAIKLLDAGLDREVALRCERGAQVAANLNHPGIVRAVELGHHDGRLYIVTDCIPGETLAQRLRQGMVPWQEACRLVTEVADAVGFAHEANVIHRDLKPSNIIIDSRSGRPRVLDFGLARSMSVDSELTKHGDFLGTPAYMPPEQVRGEDVDARADVYSLAVILYECISGRSPFNAASLDALCREILNTQPESLRRFVPGVPRELDSLILRSLDKLPAARPPTAMHLARALNEVWKSGSSSNLSSLRVAMGSPSPTLWILLGCVFAALVGTIAWAAWEHHRYLVAQDATGIAQREAASARSDVARAEAARARLEERVAGLLDRRAELESEISDERSKSLRAEERTRALQVKLEEQSRSLNTGLQTSGAWAEGTSSAMVDWVLAELDHEPDADVLAAHLLHGRGRLDECVKRIEKARAAGNTHPMLLVLQARAYMKLGDPRGQRVLGELLKTAPEGSAERLFAEALSRQGDSSALVKRAMKQDPRAGYLRILLSQQLATRAAASRDAAAGREAVEIASEAVRLDPTNYQAYWQRSLARYQLWAITGGRDRSMAQPVMDDLRRARELRPDPYYWYLMGKSYVEMAQQPQLALPELAEAKRRADAANNLEIRCATRALLGTAHLLLKDEAAAKREWLEAIRIGPRVNGTYSFLGVLNRASPELQRAITQAMPPEVRAQLERASRRGRR